MLTVQDKVKHVLGDILIDCGWKHAFYEYSGVMTNGDFTLVLYANKLKAVPAEVMSPNVVGAVMITQDPIRCSWHLEQNGWLVTSGRIPSFIVDAYTFLEEHGQKGTFYQNAMNFYINEIDKYLHCSESELMQYKKREIFCTEKKYGKTLIPVNKNVKATLMFSPQKDTKLLRSNKAYRIIDVADNKLVISEVHKQTLALLGAPIFIHDAKTFLNSTELITLESGDGYYDTISVKEITGYDCGDSELPQEFSDFGLTSDRKLVVTSAFNKFVNVTPLLNLQDCAVMKKVLSLLELGVSPELLMNCKMSCEQLDLLATIYKSGLPLERFINADYSLQYLELLYNDTSKAFQNIQQNFIAKGCSIHVASRLAFYSIKNPELLIDCDNSYANDTDVDLQLLSMKNSNYDYVVKYLRNNGIKHDKFQYAPLDTNDVDLKCFFRKFFKSDTLRFQGGAWSDFVEQVLSRGLYIYYDIKHGITLGCSQYFVGRNYNSFVIYDIAWNPIWIAVQINGRFYVNTEKENSIYV